MHKFNIGDLFYVYRTRAIYYIATQIKLGGSIREQYSEYRMHLMNTSVAAIQNMYVTSNVIDSMLKKKSWIWYPVIKDSNDQ